MPFERTTRLSVRRQLPFSALTRRLRLIVWIIAVRSPPRSSHVKSQLRLPRTSFLSSRSTRLFVSSIWPSVRKSTSRLHCR